MYTHHKFRAKYIYILLLPFFSSVEWDEVENDIYTHVVAGVEQGGEGGQQILLNIVKMAALN